MAFSRLEIKPPLTSGMLGQGKEELKYPAFPDLKQIRRKFQKKVDLKVHDSCETGKFVQMWQLSQNVLIRDTEFRALENWEVREAVESIFFRPFYEII